MGSTFDLAGAKMQRWDVAKVLPKGPTALFPATKSGNRIFLA